MVLVIEVFSESANNVINTAIVLAEKLHFNKVTTTHVLCALLKNASIRENLKESINLDSDKFLEFIDKRAEYNDFDLRVQGADNLSDELRKMLNKLSIYATMHSKTVDENDILKYITTSTDCDAYKTLIDFGISEETLKSMISPLDKTKILKNYSRDLCKLAKMNKLDPIVGRDKVINDIIEVLGRRQKSNPCLIGEAGVGKTAIVEGLAQKIVNNEVPDYLKNCIIAEIDITAIVSGTKYRGEFEERFNCILEDAASIPNIILFFDEIHILFRAGANSENDINAMNMLKPALARNGFKLIGATTTTEYRETLESNSAFERRVQPILVDEPDVNTAINMVNAVLPKYEDFHSIKFDKKAIIDSVKLSDRYVYTKKLPDKAITVLDETAARLKASKRVKDSLLVVKSEDIRRTISKISGVDIAEIADNSEITSLNNKLNNNVIGQEEAISQVVKAIKRGKSGIKDPNRPIGSFLFVGPTGVGKTELCKQLAIGLNGDVKSLIRFDMSEYSEKHSVSKLIGTPPGYVGYEDAGQLTEAVRRKPHSILLFDEIEKAHPDIFNIFLQLLDDGVLTDSHGNRVEFKNCVVIMTSNAGYGLNSIKKSLGFNSEVKINTIPEEKVVIESLEKTFRPEFINRLDKIIVFNMLDKQATTKIVKLLLDKVADRLTDKNIEVEWDDSIIQEIAKVGFSDKYGARNLKRKVQEVVEDELADALINKDILEKSKILVSYNTLENRVVIKTKIGPDRFKGENEEDMMKWVEI